MNPRLSDLLNYDQAAAERAADRAYDRRIFWSTIQWRIIDPILLTVAVASWIAAAVLITAGVICCWDHTRQEEKIYRHF